MLEKVAIAIISSEWFMLAVIGVGVRLLAGWFLSATGQKWAKYEGWMITAVKAAEVVIPDGSPNAGLRRADKALQLFLARYTAATGIVPNAAALAEIENLIAVVHDRVEAEETL